MRKNILLFILMSFLILCYPVLAGEKEKPAEEKVDSSKYLNAVRQFADNVLKYGQDTYGRKHTPLFVDGLMVRHPNDPNYGKDGVFKPVEWIAPNGDRWILSNLASQQNLFRTLDGLTKITGDPKYKQAAMDAIRYAFDNLRSPNGLLHWGGHQAYDATADKPRGTGTHELKAFYPYYQLMWEVDSRATKQFIEAFWSEHILDWSNLDMNRHGSLSGTLEVPWEYEYKGGPVFLESNGLSFMNTGSDLMYAAAILTRLSGKKEPLIWGKRLAYRYVRTRHPKTGISHGQYTKPLLTGRESYDSVMRKLVPGTTEFLPSMFPYYFLINPIAREYHRGYCMPTPEISVNEQVFIWLSQFLLGEMLGSEGDEFKKWALEELTAFGKSSYRERDNVYVPILTDGANLEGYIVKEDGPLGPKGVTLGSVPAGPSDFWAYVLGYRVTDDGYMWEMAHSIAKGNEFGNIGKTPKNSPRLNLETNCPDPYALLAFLELHRATGKNEFLEMTKKIGDNILGNRFHKGFFVASNKHTYTKFDAVDPLVLLHLHSVVFGETVVIPQVWPSMPFFDIPYRHKGYVSDNKTIYTLTKYPELPMSLQEAAAVGDINLVISLIEKGGGVDAIEDGFRKTALHRAVMSGHKDVVKVLLANGADTDARDSFTASSLHYAAERGHKDIAELLIAHDADVDAKNASGDTPMQYAAFYNRHDIIKLLLEEGATISNIHLAAYMGYLAKLDAFIQEGVGINTLDGHGYAPLHYAAQNGQKEAAELLIAKGADVDVKDWNDQTPLGIAVRGGHKDIVELLITHGADINAKNNQGMTVLHYAVRDRHKDVVELLIAKRADINAKDNYGQRPLDLAMILNRRGIFELLLEGGAELSMHTAAYLGDIDKVRSFIEAGASVNGELLPHRITPLYWAVRKNHRDVAELLIKKGAKVQVKDWRGWTPLHYAASGDKRGMTQLLITKGADVNAQDNSGENALSIARGKGHTEIVELLRKHGAKE